MSSSPWSGLRLAHFGHAPSHPARFLELASSGTPGAPRERNLYESLHQGFRELGYVGYAPGQNVVFEERFPGEVSGRSEKFADELVGLNVDVLVAVAVPSALAAQKATTTLPTVFRLIVDPVALKLVSSLARPNGNRPGCRQWESTLPPSGCSWSRIRCRAPRISLCCSIRSSPTISSRKPLSDRLHLKVSEFKAHEPEELGPAFAAIFREGCDAIVLAQGPMFFLEQARVGDATSHSHDGTGRSFRR